MTFAVLLAAAMAGQVQLAADSPASVARAFALMNDARARHGVQPYRPSFTLGSKAESQSLVQARRGRMGHSRGGNYAENVAYNQRSADDVVSDWMGSMGHRRNILNPRYTEAGIACEMGRNGPYWTACFSGP